jgi:Protein of unknown function (DUF3108)
MRCPDRRPRTRAAVAALAATLAIAAGAIPAVRARADGLRAHVIVYHCVFKGIGAGDLQLTLKPDDSREHWSYETRAFPNLLARFVVSPESRERSLFVLGNDGIQPQQYRIDDGSGDRRKLTDLHYDWVHGRVSGIARGKAIDLAIPPGTQDAMTIRAAVIADLLAGREPQEYTMLDGDELKVYVYRRLGTARLNTALGEVDTLLFSSDRKGSNGRGRTWQYWYAPSLDYLPVRIEQREDGNTRFSFAVRSLDWLEPAVSGPAQ